MPAPLIEAAIERLRGLITSGELQPGQRLPAEAELSAQLGVSRGSLRESVRGLVSAGVLDVRRGDGTYVTSLTPERLLAGLGAAVEMMGASSVLTLLETRRVIEPAATGLAALRSSDEDRVHIFGHLEQMRRQTDVDALVRHDADFHQAVATAGGNAVLTAILNGISGSTFRTRVWRGLLDEKALERTVAEHAAIASAIAAGDARLAEAAALLHVSSIEAWVRTQGDAPAE